VSPRRRSAYPGELERPVDIQLRTFPSADPTFYVYACEALDAMKRPSTRGLQDNIRIRYPLAVVRAQEDLARRGAGPLVWYAFRYGTVAHGPPGIQLIDWDGTDIAWGIVDDERRFADLNDALAAIVEQPRDAILGRALEEFTNPEDPSIREEDCGVADGVRLVLDDRAGDGPAVPGQRGEQPDQLERDARGALRGHRLGSFAHASRRLGVGSRGVARHVPEP